MKNATAERNKNKISKDRPRKNNKRTLRKTKETKAKEMIIDCSHLSISSFTYKNKKYILVILYSPKDNILSRIVLDEEQANQLRLLLRDLLEQNPAYR